MPNPWDNDPIVGQPAAPQSGGAYTVGTPKPKPRRTQVVAGNLVDLDSGEAVPIPGLPQGGGDTKPQPIAGRPGWFMRADGTAFQPTGLPADPNETLTPEQKNEVRSEALQKVKLARSLKDRSANGWFATGFGAPTMAGISGATTAGGVAADVETLRASGALQRIMELTQRTGKNPLTPISNADFIALGNSLSNLDIGQDDAQFQRNVGTAEDMYRRAFLAAGGTEEELEAALKGEGGENQNEQPPAGTAIAGASPPAGPSFTPSADGTRSVIDPGKQELGNKIAGLVSKGADRNTIMGFAVRADPSLRADPKFKAWVDEALKFRKQQPGAKFSVDPSFYTTQVPLNAQEQQSNETAQSGVGSFFTHAGDAVTAGNLGNIADKLGGSGEQVRRGLQAQSEINPGASMGGDVAGGVLAALGGEAALARLGMAPGLLRGVAADAGYGGVSGGTNSDSDNFLGKLADAGKGAAAAGAGSVVGSKATGALARSAKGVTNPTVGYVAREVPDALTVGQMVSQSGRLGAAVKGIEDRLSSVPVLGDTINARRIEGLQKMNTKAFDRALEPIKDNVAGSYGEDAVAAAQDKVSQAFQKALNGKAARIDTDFINQAGAAKAAIQKLPRVADEVESSIDEVINAYVDPATLSISGENMQAVLRDLGQIKRSYAGDPLGHRIGKAVDQMSDSIEGIFRRQAPEVMPDYEAAKLAFKRVSTLEDAVLRAKNTNGVFTPAQLGLADRGNTVKFGGKHKAAAGGGEFHEFQRNMQEVLPSKVPDSGTAGRLIVPAAVVGAGAGADYATGGTGTGLTLASLLTLAYSRKGQALARAATRPGGKTAQKIAKGARKAAPLIGHAAGTQAALGTTRD